jgi:hypothetical protein
VRHLFQFGITLRDRGHLHRIGEAALSIPTGQRERFLKMVGDVLRPRVHLGLTETDIKLACQEALRRTVGDAAGDAEHSTRRAAPEREGV